MSEAIESLNNFFIYIFNPIRDILQISNHGLDRIIYLYMCMCV